MGLGELKDTLWWFMSMPPTHENTLSHICNDMHFNSTGPWQIEDPGFARITATTSGAGAAAVHGFL